MTNRQVFSVTLLIVSTLAILRSMGREWWCSCAGFIPWCWDPWSSHNSQHLIDYYSFSHVLHGVVFFGVLHVFAADRALTFRFQLAVLLEAGWEILENSSFVIERYRSVTSALNYYGDSIINSAGDLGSCALGFLLASRLPWKVTLLGSLLIETSMLILIRDNLTLNVLMLVWPVESIKSWQLGVPNM